MTTKLPKVLHVVYSLGVGGAEIYLSSMSSAAHRLGAFDSSVLGWKKSGPLASDLQEAGVDVHNPLQLGRRPMFLQLGHLANQIAKIANDIGATIIHGHLNDGGLLAVMAARRANLTSIAHVHSNHILPVSLSGGKKMIWERAARWTYRHADRVLVISEEVEKTARERFDLSGDRIRRAPIGIAKPVAERQRSEVRQELGFSNDCQVMMFVGRLVSNKNQKALIHMMRPLLDKQPAAKLLLVGDGPDEAALSALVDEMGLGQSVKLLGRRRDVADLLSASDLFVTSSETEGVSLAILEAFAIGLPVVAAEAPGNSELVGSKRGWLSPSDDPKELSETVYKALSKHSETQKRVAEAKSYWDANHSLESAVDALASIYRESLRSADN